MRAAPLFKDRLTTTIFPLTLSHNKPFKTRVLAQYLNRPVGLREEWGAALENQYKPMMSIFWPEKICPSLVRDSRPLFLAGKWFSLPNNLLRHWRKLPNQVFARGLPRQRQWIQRRWDLIGLPDHLP